MLLFLNREKKQNLLTLLFGSILPKVQMSSLPPMKRIRIDINKTYHYTMITLNSFISQPTDTTHHILLFMDFIDIMQLSLTCSHFHSTINHCDSYIKNALLYYSTHPSLKQTSMYNLQIFNTVWLMISILSRNHCLHFW